MVLVEKLDIAKCYKLHVNIALYIVIAVVFLEVWRLKIIYSTLAARMELV